MSSAPAFQTLSNQTSQNGTILSVGNNSGRSSGLSAGGQVGVALGIVIFALLLGSLGLWATTQTRAKREAYGPLNETETAGRRTAETRTW